MPQVPDSPGSSRAFWMTAEDNATAKARMDRVKSLPPMVGHVALSTARVADSDA
jgi:hypothetical protein